MGNFITYLATADLEATISDLSVKAVLWGSVLLVLLVIAAVLFANKKPRIKLPLFVSITTVVVGTTLVISGGTIYLNVNSATGGPVHWHADIEIWACGNELELRNPTGFLSNKIGTATYHEHNDKRIHLEGVPVTLPEDASLGKFMNVVGGDLKSDSLMVPLNEDKLFENGHGEEDGDGSGAPDPEAVQPFLATEASGRVAKFTNGQKCREQEAEVQVFVYNYDRDKKTYSQRKLTEPATYAISHYGEVPPGDCVIMEFGPRRDRTDKLCKQYGVRDTDKCEKFGVSGSKTICENKEVEATPVNSAELKNQCREELSKPPYGMSAECAKIQGEF